MFDQDTLLSQLGNPYTNAVVERLRRFVYISPNWLSQLASMALSEQWGQRNFVLEKYLAVHIPWSLEQGRYTSSNNQLYITAGHLQTRYGTPIYMVLEQNQKGPQPPWYVSHVGSQVSAPELPVSPDIPPNSAVPLGLEIVMVHDHILGEHANRVPFLSQTPPVAQMCAVAGAIQWSLNRGLQLPYWYFGKMNYLVPLYLQSREDITQAPDLIAPIQVNPNSLLVRTVLEPHMPYANARVAVRRHDQLPAWLLSAWSQHSARASEREIEDPEAN